VSGAFRRPRQTAGVVGPALRLVVRAAPRLAATALTLQLLAGVLATVQLLVLKRVLDVVLRLDRPGASVRPVVVPLALLALATATSSVATAVLPRLQRLLGELVSREVWGRLLDVGQRVPLESFDTPAFYDRLQRVQDHALDKPVATTTALISLVGNSVASVGLIGVLLSVSWTLLPLVAVAGLPLVVASRLTARREFAFAVAQSPPYRLRLYLAELLTRRDAAKEVRAFGSGGALRRRHDAVYGGFIAALRKHVRAIGTITVIATAASAVLSTLALVVLVALVADHQASVAQAATAAVTLRLLAGRVQGTAGSASGLYESRLFLTDLAAFLDLQGDAPPEAAPAALTGAHSAQLSLRGVCFTYPGASGPALVGVDLDIPPGAVIALVGENGSGKTTLSKLVAQLYAPTEGEVRWDGELVGAPERVALRDRVAVLFQDFLHYRLPARDNVTLGRASAAGDADRLHAAGAAAGAEEVVAGLDDGWDTVLSAEFGGQDLSLGQWQRVALARAYFRDAPLVVLDEPTASLDPRAEARLFADVRGLLAGRSVLLVTHRLASVRDADLILVLDRGRVVERGTHSQLLRARGTYAELFRLQAAGYALEEPARSVRRPRTAASTRAPRS